MFTEYCMFILFTAVKEQLPLDKPARGRYTMDNRIEQPSSGGRMLPAEIGRQTP